MPGQLLCTSRLAVKDSSFWDSCSPDYFNSRDQPFRTTWSASTDSILPTSARIGEGHLARQDVGKTTPLGWSRPETAISGSKLGFLTTAGSLPGASIPRNYPGVVTDGTAHRLWITPAGKAISGTNLSKQSDVTELWIQDGHITACESLHPGSNGRNMPEHRRTHAATLSDTFWHFLAKPVPKVHPLHKSHNQC